MRIDYAVEKPRWRHESQVWEFPAMYTRETPALFTGPYLVIYIQYASLMHWRMFGFTMVAFVLGGCEQRVSHFTGKEIGLRLGNFRLQGLDLAGQCHFVGSVAVIQVNIMGKMRGRAFTRGYATMEWTHVQYTKKKAKRRAASDTVGGTYDVGNDDVKLALLAAAVGPGVLKAVHSDVLPGLDAAIGETVDMDEEDWGVVAEGVRPVN
jgi:hypothetical protein